ncbi:MAG TPA: di-heme oxidoredictase family protein [Bryobacteraceae bacterium]|nr:di-heme oxidoredictase family protein [Bryobacteraceae bacterium]
MSIRKLVLRIACAACCVTGAGNLNAQTDPGPRGGGAGAGGKFPTLNFNETLLFTQAQARFKEVDSVSGGLAGEAGSGLGPTFNGNSCAMCHAQPAVGGSSPGLTSKQNPVQNPQVALATLDGATNTVPSFITVDGPVREARFVANDGGVHGLYTIKGRKDAPGCTLAQPDFATQLAAHNVIFRIPTPTFGLGLVENTPDATLQANLAATASARAALGIGGRFNTSGNDGTITRFGWKAQNKSLQIFAGEAYNVEQGVSNEVFPNERSAVPGCVFNATPEDTTNILDPDFHLLVGTASKMSSDTVNFAIFMRLSAPPAADTASTSERNGQALFASTGCVLCHSSSLTSASSNFTGMSTVTYHPYSDIAIHHMGSGLADGVPQGAAGADEFRTAPLWGLGQRLFFLHDGRTSDLLQAIAAHDSTGSEAHQVIQNFVGLTASQKQDLLNFLRSL